VLLTINVENADAVGDAMKRAGTVFRDGPVLAIVIGCAELSGSVDDDSDRLADLGEVEGSDVAALALRVS